jgi:uncharacterized damage-inducible protein DinB
MSEHARIADQIRRAARGDAWHGPALAEALDDVSADEAAARPIPDAHTIWELVGHVTTWTEVVRRRFGGEPCDPAAADNFPAVADPSPRAWAAACDAVLAAHEALAAAVERHPDADLDAMLPGRGYSAYVLLHGAVQHTLYHVGQIAILKRALGTRAP